MVLFHGRIIHPFNLFFELFWVCFFFNFGFVAFGGGLEVFGIYFLYWAGIFFYSGLQINFSIKSSPSNHLVWLEP